MQNGTSIAQTLEKYIEIEEEPHVIQTIEKLLALEKQHVRKDLRELKMKLKKFEKKYNMASEKAYEEFNKGKSGDEQDYFEWHALYDMYLLALRKLKVIES